MEVLTCYQLPNSMKHTPTPKAPRHGEPLSEAQKMVGFRIPAREFSRCLAYADEQKRSHSSFIRMLALKGLEHFEAERSSPTLGRSRSGTK